MTSAGRPRFRRVAGWQEDLPRFLEEIRFKPFCWGEHDCGLLMADWVHRMTGTDPGAAYRGRYTTAMGAARRLKKVAGGGVVAAATHAFGAPLSSPILARRGDVVAVRAAEVEGGEFALGIVGPDGVTIHMATEYGTAAWPLWRAEFAWAVG